MTEKKDTLPIEESVVEITGPVKLRNEDNFFAQYPFDDILTDVVSPYDGESPQGPRLEGLGSDLCILLHRFANRIESATSAELKKTQARLFFTDVTEHLPPERSSLYPFAQKAPLLKDALAKTLQELKGFPYWMKYVRGQQDEYVYLPNGDKKWLSETPEASLPLSYLAWVEDYLTREKKIQKGFAIQVTQGTFPQQFGQGSREGMMRTWRIKRTRGLNK